MKNDPLLAPFDMGKGLRLRNRVVSTSHEPGYTEAMMPTDRYRLYHVEKAKGGIGLTMIGGSAVVSKDSPAAFGNIAMYTDEVVPWLRRLADDVHAEGAATMIQLTHLGRRTADDNSDWLPTVSASETREPAHRSFPKPAEHHDLARITEDFVAAALRAQSAGLDGIELIHYGHLLDSFVSPWLNRRTDEYGLEAIATGLTARRNFVTEVLDRIVDAVGDGFHVGVRMAIDEARPDGLQELDGINLARTYVDHGASFISAVIGTIETDKTLTDVIPGMGMKSAPFLAPVARLKQAVGVPVMHAARIQDVATARHAIESGAMDLVGMVRPQIADPHLVRKLEEGQEEDIRPCVGASYCLDAIYTGGGAICIHNHATGREATIPHITVRAPENGRRRVVIVGAGPAGLEAARVAGLRGHHVTVLEANHTHGGQLHLATVVEEKKDLVGIADWRYQQALKHGVEFRFDTYADAAEVLDLDPDVVVVATGGMTGPAGRYLGVPGIDLVTDPWDVLGRGVKDWGSVLVVDDEARYAPLDVALHAARGGSTVEIVTPDRVLGASVGAMNISRYVEGFDAHDVTLTLNRRLVAVERNTTGGRRLHATLDSEYSGLTWTRAVDHVVLVHGTRANTELYDALVDRSVNAGAVDIDAFTTATQTVPPEALEPGRYALHRIGDAVSSRNIHAAIFDGFRLLNGM